MITQAEIAQFLKYIDEADSETPDLFLVAAAKTWPNLPIDDLLAELDQIYGEPDDRQ